MITTAPSAGQDRVYKTGGYFRLGSSPTGQLTADVVQGSATSNRTAAQLVKAIVIGPGGISSGDVSSADMAAGLHYYFSTSAAARNAATYAAAQIVALTTLLGATGLLTRAALVLGFVMPVFVLAALLGLAAAGPALRT